MTQLGLVFTELCRSNLLSIPSAEDRLIPKSCCHGGYRVRHTPIAVNASPRRQDATVDGANSFSPNGG